MQITDTRIDIDSKVETVWQVLTDFSSYGEWNPFIPRIAAQFFIGGDINFDEQRPKAPLVTYHSTIQYIDIHARFGWSGGVKTMWQVEHIFLLEKIADNKTRFIQQEISTGILVPFIRKKLAATREGFLMMNEALKNRAEELTRAHVIKEV